MIVAASVFTLPPDLTAAFFAGVLLLLNLERLPTLVTGLGRLLRTLAGEFRTELREFRDGKMKFQRQNTEPNSQSPY